MLKNLNFMLQHRDIMVIFVVLRPIRNEQKIIYNDSGYAAVRCDICLSAAAFCVR